MQIQVSRRHTGNIRAMRQENTLGSPTAEQKGNTATPAGPADSVAISPEGAYQAKLRDFHRHLQQMEMLTQQLLQQLESSKKETKAQADSFRKELDCMEIARRIMCGDTVPAKDMQFLAKYYPELFAQAIMMRMNAEHPQKHKRLTKDEQTEPQDTTVCSGAEGGEQGDTEAEAGEGKVPAAAETQSGGQG